MPANQLKTLLLTPVARRLAAAGWFRRVGPWLVPPIDRALHRLTGGRVILPQAILPGIVLTTTGHRSGEPRQAPLICLVDDDGSFVVVGSNFGREGHPVWTTNLLNEPAAEVGYQGRRIPVTATLLEGDERSEMWPRLLEVWPVYAKYVERSGRELRIFRLSPRPGSA